MAMLFTPCVMALIGRRAWWPGSVARKVASRYQ